MHPYIIQTPQHEDQEVYIEEFITAHQVDTQKIFHIIPAASSILLDQVREVRRDLQRSARSEKTILFHTFDRATPEAQNALLKVLEELGDAHQFVLFTQRVDAILPTIRSRCFLQVMDAKAPAVVDALLADQLRILKDQRSGQLLSHELFQPASREDAIQLFTHIITALHADLKTGDTWSVQASKKALSLQSLLQTNNLNHQLAVDQWLLFSLYIS